MKALKIFTSIMMSIIMLFGISVPALADGSKTDVVEIVDSYDGSGNKIDLTVSDIADGVPVLTEEIAAELIGNVSADELVVLWQRDITSPALPATITFSLPLQADQDVFVFHYASAWNLEATGKGDKVTVTFDDLSPVGIVARKPIQKADSDNSSANPETGDTNQIALWASLLAVSFVGAVVTIVVIKKRTAKASH